MSEQMDLMSIRELLRETNRALDALHPNGWEQGDAEALGATVEGVVDTMENLIEENDRWRSGLQKIASHPHNQYQGAEQYDIGVADGHRCAAKLARAILEEGTQDE